MNLIFQQVIKTSLMGSVLVIILLTIKFIFKNTLSKKWHYAVWFLLVIRLILPFAPQFEYSIYNIFTPVVTQDNSMNSDARLEYTENHTEIYETEGNKLVQTDLSLTKTKELITLQKKTTDIFTIIWIFGSVITAGYTIIISVLFYRKVKFSVPCHHQPTQMILKDCFNTVSSKPIPLFINNYVKGPLLFGFIKPKLIIPEMVLKRLSTDEKKHVFLHEIMHYKQKDILVNWLTAVLMSVYWFNPLILYAFHKMRDDCEISCDERVLDKLQKDEYNGYGRTILNLAEYFTKPYYPACTSGIIQKKSTVRRRIYMIASFRRKTAFATVMAFMLTILVGCSSLTNAKLNTDNNNNGEPAADATFGTTILPDETEQAENDADTQNKKDTEAEDSIENPDVNLGDSIYDNVDYYIGKLKDKTFTDTYGDSEEPKVWYTAAEELGQIGKPSIPKLIEKLDTDDDYERALALYALLLASQQDNVTEFTNGEYIKVNLDFDSKSHVEMVDKAMSWWNKYRNQF